MLSLLSRNWTNLQICVWGCVGGALLVRHTVLISAYQTHALDTATATASVNS
jgi:hypothetical protein